MKTLSAMLIYMCCFVASAVQAQSLPVFSGAPMSMNFPKIELRTALQLIADFSGVNMVVSDSVSGSLSLRLNQVPWDQVLYTVLQTKGLGQQTLGDVLWVAPLVEFAAKEKAALEGRAALQALEPLQTRAFAMNYAKVQDLLVPLLSSTGVVSNTPAPRLLSVRGSAMIDVRTNQLFVTDVADKLAQVEMLIQRIDIPQRQVLIEARIIEASDSFAASLGVRMSRGDNNSSLIKLPAQGFQGLEAATLALSLFDASKTRLLGIELSALEAEGLGRVVASPRLVTADQAKAIIEQGTELPYQVAAGNGATSIAFRKANLRLEVTPRITPEGSITMDLDVHKDSVGQSTPAGFAIDTKHVSTQVRVEDGGTVMIGGIYETSNNQNLAGVPGLRHLPGLGWLFGNRSNQRSKQELLIFLSPKMLTQRALAP
ncbi:MAG: type IV pilus secretin PilQ [Burkholderiales bacterium]|nr:type IV pilus secretin PilQ [Burkholderiales bacterium]